MGAQVTGQRVNPFIASQVRHLLLLSCLGGGRELVSLPQLLILLKD